MDNRASVITIYALRSDFSNRLSFDGKARTTNHDQRQLQILHAQKYGEKLAVG